MPLLSDLRAKKTELEAIALRYGVSNIRVFGSVVRGEETQDSDVDLLIHFDRERHDAFDLGGFQYYSSQLLGRRVDVVMDHHVYPPLQARIFSEAKVL